MRLVLIDDSVEVLDAVRRLLEREGVAVVAVATTGADGVHHVKQLEPDVVLLDIDLGEENGFDVCRRLAATGVDSALILTSALPEYADLVGETPAAGFLPKGELSRRAIEEILEITPDGQRDSR